MSDGAPVRRDTARLLVRDGDGRVLLFRFTPEGRAPFWATPGGAVDPGESFAEAARRELREETGFDHEPHGPVDIREVRYRAFWGDEIVSEEHYFTVRVAETMIDTSGHEDIERQVMTHHDWFDPAMLAACPDPIYPEDLAALLARTEVHHDRS